MITKSKEKDLDYSLLNYVPGQKLHSFMGMALEPQILTDYAINLGQDDMMQYILQQGNVNDKDVSESFTGDAISVSFSDTTGADQNLHAAMLMKLKDSTRLSNILKMPGIAKFVTAVSNGFYKLGSDPLNARYFKLNKNVLIMANNIVSIERVLNFNQNGIFTDRIKKTLPAKIPFAFTINFSEVIELALKNATFGGLSYTNIMALDNANSYFKDSKLMAGHFADGALQFTFEQEMNDTQHNSLAVIMHAIDKAKKDASSTSANNTDFEMDVSGPKIRIPAEDAYPVTGQ